MDETRPLLDCSLDCRVAAPLSQPADVGQQSVLSHFLFYYEFVHSETVQHT
jgi:hypothetical protein